MQSLLLKKAKRSLLDDICVCSVHSTRLYLITSRMILFRCCDSCLTNHLKPRVKCHNTAEMRIVYNISSMCTGVNGQ